MSLIAFGIIASLEERQKEIEMDEEGESSKSVKPSVQSQRGKAASSRQGGIYEVLSLTDCYICSGFQFVYLSVQYVLLCLTKLIYLFFIIFRVQKSDSSSDSGSDSDSDSELIGPPVPPQHAAQQGDDDDDEHVGPPLPPGYTGSTAHSDDDDDEEGEAQDDDDDVCLNYTISQQAVNYSILHISDYTQSV